MPVYLQVIIQLIVAFPAIFRAARALTREIRKMKAEDRGEAKAKVAGVTNNYTVGLAANLNDLHSDIKLNGKGHL